MILGLNAPCLPGVVTRTAWVGKHPGLTESAFEKGGKSMKKYIAPEMMALSFAAEEAISAPLEGSNSFNDGELEW